MPLQVSVWYWMWAEQLWATHSVPLAHRPQAPAPSQKPSCPQVSSPVAAHSALGSVLFVALVQAPEPLHTRQSPQSVSGSVWAAWSVQVPTLPEMLHASQSPPQATLQHTPSVQMPLVHSMEVPQLDPLGFLPVQALPLQ